MKFLVLCTLGSISVAQKFTLSTQDEAGKTISSSSLTKNAEGVWEGFVPASEAVESIKIYNTNNPAICTFAYNYPEAPAPDVFWKDKDFCNFPIRSGSSKGNTGVLPVPGQEHFDKPEAEIHAWCTIDASMTLKKANADYYGCSLVENSDEVPNIGRLPSWWLPTVVPLPPGPIASGAFDLQWLAIDLLEIIFAGAIPCESFGLSLYSLVSNLLAYMETAAIPHAMFTAGDLASAISDGVYCFNQSSNTAWWNENGWLWGNLSTFGDNWDNGTEYGWFSAAAIYSAATAMVSPNGTQTLLKRGGRTLTYLAQAFAGFSVA